MSATARDAQRDADSAGPTLVPLVAADGARSEGRLFPAAAATSVAVCLPAMGVDASYYDPLGKALAARGVASLTAELRGNGSSSLRAGRGVDFGYREVVELDVATAVAAARERFPGLPVRLVGHSLGGHLSVLYAALRPRAVDGIVLIAAGSPYFRAYRGRGRVYVLLGSLALRGISAALGYLPAARSAAAVARPPAHRRVGVSARSGRFAFTGAPADFPAALAAADLPVLALSLAEDSYAPPGAVDHLAGMHRSPVLVTRHHTRPGELGDGIDHFRWVLAARSCGRHRLSTG